MASGNNNPIGGETSSNKRDDGDYYMDDDGGESSSSSKRSCSSGDDDDYDYDDESGCHYDKPYVILTEDEVRKLQADDTAKIAEVLSISPALAAFLLRRYKWMPTNLQDDWFSDDGRVRAAFGLPENGGAATALSTSPLICNICFDLHPAGRTRSASCRSHFYCDACWRGYIHVAVGDGASCLSLRCPDPSCLAAVVGDLVGAIAGAVDVDRYARFAFRSYVEDNGGRIKWCPGRGCTRAVKFTGVAGDDAAEIFCDCKHGFCWDCGEEAHRPVTCGTVRAWVAKNESDSETANWVLANTKLCPNCHKAIEKNQGCNHMRCRCGHQFCWLCLQPADTAAGQHYSCETYQHPPEVKKKATAAVESKEEATARRARASLDRYLFHYERWGGNLKSMEKARQDMEKLEESELEGMAAVVGRPVTELAFVTEAYEQIVYGRRVLRWAHAYGYYLDPERDGTKRQLFDFLQGQANESLERLHHAAELERKDVFKREGEAVEVARRYKEYQQKMLPLTAATRNFMGNLVEAFETDLPEVGTMNF